MHYRVLQQWSISIADFKMHQNDDNEVFPYRLNSKAIYQIVISVACYMNVLVKCIYAIGCYPTQ